VKLCYVTDRKALAGTAAEQIGLLAAKIEQAARAGVDWIQIREKDLPGRAIGGLVREAVRRAPARSRVLVNDRLDVACTAGARGVHLGEQSLPVAEAIRFLQAHRLPKEFLVGASAHTLAAALAAEKNGADYVIFGPIFSTPSKALFGEPLGVERLLQVCQQVTVPVLAIGGITLENAPQCIRAGAAGLAAIRLFQGAQDLNVVVRELRAPARR
jgi:thiamine-phosphate pyrophosphorylase